MTSRSMVMFDRQLLERHAEARTAVAVSLATVCEVAVATMPSAVKSNNLITTFSDESSALHLGLRVPNKHKVTGYGNVEVALKLHSVFFEGDEPRNEKVVAVCAYQEPFSPIRYKLLSGKEASLQFRVMQVVEKGVYNFIAEALTSREASESETEEFVSYLVRHSEHLRMPYGLMI
jgi:hypothetical protein